MKTISKLLAIVLGSIIIPSFSVHATEIVKSNDVSVQSIKHPIDKEKLVKAVENNDAEAQHFLGNLYFFGKGGYEKDYKKAFEWYEKSAKNSFSKAQIALADMYLNGFGTEPNAAKSVEWLNKAIKQNDTNAMVLLAIMYSKGNGVEKDSK